MIYQTKIFLQLFSLICLLASCRLTRNDVIGKWAVSQNDTLIIKQDNSFLLVKSSRQLNNGQSNNSDSSSLFTSGHWTLYKKAIHFDFSDTTQNFGGGCTTFQYWWTKGSKKKLVRPMTCKSPTHEFRSINKIE
jgi:hypothetical protein